MVLIEKKVVTVEDLEIYKLARKNSVLIYEISLNHLPHFERFETGSQIRRSVASVRINIVEGFYRRNSKKEFLRFLRYAHASNNETIEHLKLLNDVKSFNDEKLYQNAKENLVLLSKKLFRFMEAVSKNQ
jgi:four helix bundle protein